MARALAEDGCCQTSSFRRTRAVIEHMCSQPRDGRDAASIVFDLPGYDVVDAVDLPLGGRRVVVQARARDEACPGCGVLSARVHAWARQHVTALPCGGDAVEVVVRKPRMVCAEPACPRRTFTQDRKSTRLNSSHVASSYA